MKYNLLDFMRAQRGKKIIVDKYPQKNPQNSFIFT